MIVQFGIHYAIYVASAFTAPVAPPPVILIPPVVLVAPAPPVAVQPRVEVLTLLERAQRSVGTSRTQYGFSEFWCAEYVEFMLLLSPQYDSPLDSPAQLRLLVPAVTEPAPGDLVFVSFQPENGEVHHVAIVESVNADGSVNTIEGNGPDREYVARGIRLPFEIISYGRTN